MRGVSHQLDAVRTHPRRIDLSTMHRFNCALRHIARGLFFCLTFSYKCQCSHGDSHEKWIKEKSLDISTGSRPEDHGPQENPRRPNCQEVKTVRRGNAAESIQYRIIARLGLTKRSVQFSSYEASPRAGFFHSLPEPPVHNKGARQQEHVLKYWHYNY